MIAHITQYHIALFLACGFISALLWTATIIARPTAGGTENE